MIDSMHVLDVLRERGYVPIEAGQVAGETWFDLQVRDRARVRAVLTPEDGCWIYLFAGSQAMVCEWEARFLGAPGAVFLATLDAAEREARR